MSDRIAAISQRLKDGTPCLQADIAYLLARLAEAEQVIHAARSADGVNEDDAPEHFGNEAAHAWVCGYEAGQSSICDVLAGYDAGEKQGVPRG